MKFFRKKNRKKKSKPSIKKRLHLYAVIAKYAILICSFTFFAIISYNAYKYSLPVKIDDIPLVKKGVCSIKKEPGNLGGITIPHQNKTIYDSIRYEYVPQKNNKDEIKKEEKTSKAAPNSKNTKNNPSTKSIFDLVQDNSLTIILGETGTKAAGEKKLARLKKQYPSLRGNKYEIKKVKKKGSVRYKILMHANISKKRASEICKLLNKQKEECSLQ